MVRLLASLLVLSFAMGSVLASSDKYQRRDIRNARVGITIPTSSDHFQSRGLDEGQDQFERDLDAEEFSVREYLLDERDDFDDLEARQPSIFGAIARVAGKAAKIVKSRIGRTAIKRGKDAAQQHKNNNNGGDKRVKDALQHIMGAIIKVRAKGLSASNPRGRIRPRGLEENDDLSQRDLDAEELFERDYDLLDERDDFDDLD